MSKRRWCDCGRPATVHSSGTMVCFRCRELERRVEEPSHVEYAPAKVGRLTGLTVQIHCLGKCFQWRLCDAAVDCITVAKGITRTAAEGRRRAAKLARRMNYKSITDAVNAGYRRFAASHCLPKEQFNPNSNHI